MWQDIKNIYHLCQSVTANVVNGFPSKDIFNIGVTGTDGKTTTTSMIYHILKTAGLKAAMISTVGAIIDDKVYSVGFHVTNPDALRLQPYIRRAKKAGVKYLIIEVTSNGLHQNRVFGIPFKIGVLTNITNEHLDYHKTYKNYVKAKSRLFRKTPVAVLNIDDKSFDQVKQYIKNKRVISYGLGEGADLSPEKFSFKTNLVGGFNQYNALAAIAVAKEIGIEDGLIRRALLSFVAPTGREEIVYENGFTVMIDFAHTPGAFQALLQDLQMMKRGRLIHVFGSAGKRDKYKRPEMGRISANFSDVIVLTAEDPRNETVAQINEEIESGISEKFDKRNLYKIEDRKEAIAKAIEMARDGDLVLLTGKAHEASMNYGKGEEPWSEHQAVREALEKRK